MGYTMPGLSIRYLVIEELSKVWGSRRVPSCPRLTGLGWHSWRNHLLLSFKEETLRKALNVKGQPRLKTAAKNWVFSLKSDDFKLPFSREKEAWEWGNVTNQTWSHFFSSGFIMGAQWQPLACGLDPSPV